MIFYYLIKLNVRSLCMYIFFKHQIEANEIYIFYLQLREVRMRVIHLRLLKISIRIKRLNIFHKIERI